MDLSVSVYPFIELVKFKVAPIPEPASRYHLPLEFTKSTGIVRQNSRLYLCVPLSSPRDTKIDLAAAIFLYDSTTFLAF